MKRISIDIVLGLLLIANIIVVDGAEKKDYGEKSEKDTGGASIFSMEYLPIGHLRTDPVISQSCLSNHVHTFYGPPKIHPSVTYEELRATSDTKPHEATSGNLLENQSLYWHPSFYKVQDDGTREILEPDWTTVYYAFNKGETKSFPEGFRMIGGPPDGLELTCYSEQYTYQSDKGAGSKDTDKETDNKGTGYQDIDKDTSYNNTDEYTDKNDSAEEDKSFFPSDPCEELAASLVFPTCWDGINLDSDSHRSHVVYAIGKESAGLSTFGGSDFYCPDSHPVLLPQILLFLRFVNYSGGSHELSNGDGWDWHADYIMGWEEKVLQDILDDDDCNVIKDLPCGTTRLRDVNGTGSTKKPEASWAEMSKILRQVRVPMANTICITDELVDKIQNPPRGGCAGNITSTDSCQQPAFPEELLGSKIVDNDVGIKKNGNEKSTGYPQRTALVVLIGSILSTVASVL